AYSRDGGWGEGSCGLKDQVRRLKGETEELRHERDMLRIVVQTLRESGEENQSIVKKQEEKIRQASMQAVKQEALISALRKRLSGGTEVA
ncbi:unnamed protein product, partial [Discosporangium mesarthrocarpum]